MTTRMQREFAGKDKNIEVRINKFLSEAGVCSRREAERLIEAGKVTVDGAKAVQGMKVLPAQDIVVDGKRLKRETEMVLLAVNKPKGVVCTTDKRWGDTTVEELIRYPKRVFHVGRLDKDSEGLLLMTNNGEILNKIMRAGNFHEKEYEVTVHKRVTDEFLRKLAEGGIPILDTVTRPCKTERIGKNSFRITLTQGLNRQIRRMCEHFGYQVVKLVRVRIMNIRLGRLKQGTYRVLTEREVETLYELLKDSSNDSKYKER